MVVDGPSRRHGFKLPSWSRKRSTEQEKCSCTCSKVDANGGGAPTVASWCPPLDLWYTMGRRESARFSSCLNGLNLLSHPTECVRNKLNFKKRLHFDTRITFEEEAMNIVSLTPKQIHEDFFKMTGKMPPTNPRKRFMNKGCFPGEMMRRLEHK